MQAARIYIHIDNDDARRIYFRNKKEVLPLPREQQISYISERIRALFTPSKPARFQRGWLPSAVLPLSYSDFLFFRPFPSFPNPLFSFLQYHLDIVLVNPILSSLRFSGTCFSGSRARLWRRGLSLPLFSTMHLRWNEHTAGSV